MLKLAAVSDLALIGRLQAFRSLVKCGTRPQKHIEAPPAGFGMAADDHSGLGGRHVPIRAEVWQLAGGGEQAPYKLRR